MSREAVARACADALAGAARPLAAELIYCGGQGLPALPPDVADVAVVAW